jgi:hypothetical protein
MICQNENYQHDHVQTMTSLEIAELTGKQHFHVMEAIRKMEPAWKKVAESNFRLGSYKDAIQDMFGIVIDCEPKTYRYYISNREVLQPPNLREKMRQMIAETLKRY